MRFLYGRLLCRRLTQWFGLLFLNMFYSVLIIRYRLLHIEWPLLLLSLDSCADRSLLLLLAGLLSRLFDSLFDPSQHFLLIELVELICEVFPKLLVCQMIDSLDLCIKASRYRLMS